MLELNRVETCEWKKVRCLSVVLESDERCLCILLKSELQVSERNSRSERRQVT